VADDNSIRMFDEVKAVSVQTVNGKRMVTDEQTVEEQEFMDAAMKYAVAERLRSKLSRKASTAEWNAIDRVHRAEKKLYALFVEGDRSIRMNGMYNQYLKLLVDPPEPQA
jgi:hypothetical protein